MRCLAIALGLLLLAGCGSLQVRVDVLDPEYLVTIAEQADLRRALQVSVDQTEEGLAEHMAPVKQQQLAFYRGLSEAYRAESKTLAANGDQNKKADAAELAKLADDLVDPNLLDNFYAQVQAKLHKANTEIRTLFLSLGQDEQESLLLGPKVVTGRLAALLRIRGSVIAEFDNNVSLETNDLVDSAKSRLGSRRVANLAGAAAKVVAGVNKFGRAQAGQKTLRQDANAYAVASAPENYWAKGYNHNFARGYFGDFDVAIRLNEGGDYTIKGVLFDPSKVAQVASKVMVQSLLLAAQAFGVPIGTAAASGSGAALSKSSAALTQLQARAEERTAVIEDQRQALLDIAATILSEQVTIESGSDSQRSNLKTAVTNKFNSHKNRLQFSTVPGN